MIGSAIKDLRFDGAGRTIQRCFQKRAGFKVASEKPLALDLDIVVENHGRRSVHVDDKSASIKRNRRQAHRIEQAGRGGDGSTRTRNGGDFEQAPSEGSENTLFFSAQLASI